MDLALAPPSSPPVAAAPRGGGGAASAATTGEERNARAAAGQVTTAAARREEVADATAGAPPVAPARALGKATEARRAAADAATAAARVAMASKCRGRGDKRKRGGVGPPRTDRDRRVGGRRPRQHCHRYSRQHGTGCERTQGIVDEEKKWKAIRQRPLARRRQEGQARTRERKVGQDS